MNDDPNTIDLATTIAKLEAIEIKLLEIDTDDLEPEEQNTLAEKLDQVSQNITKLRDADLQALSDEFKAREPELRTAAGHLEEDLSELTDAVEMINVASAGLKTITDIIALLGSVV